jgi:puromycin-sensitive aminopeptidase
MAFAPTDPNFRLPTDVRPLEYRAQLKLHHEQRSFEGVMQLVLKREAAGTDLVLHAVDLDIQEAAIQAGGQISRAEIQRYEPSGTILLRFPGPMPAGESTIELKWKGQYNQGLRGLYLTGNVAVTQFEAADARRVFPCFDEPAFKARWTLTLTAPENLAVLANQRLLKDSTKEGWRTHEFETTELLSSYLVAFACGDFVEAGKGRAAGIEVRTFCAREKTALAAFGQKVAEEVLPRLQEYFGLPYAFGKVDQIGLMDFGAGAMENAGLITYREQALLSDPKTSSLAAQKRIAEIITHELAHQWFGNWVTMVWWDDLWLNEAFATWMAYKIADPWRPEWRIWLDFNVGRAGAMNMDSLESTHPVRSEVHNANEATEAFDLITYEKGGAVLRMIEAFLGEVPFREGIRAYMKSFARSNAVADDLWNALSKSSNQPVLELANAWIRKGGHPMVCVELTPKGVRLSQERFFLERSKSSSSSSDELWPVPMVIRYEDAKGVHVHRLLFREKESEISLPMDGRPKWLVGNAQSTGFYRVKYSDALLTGLKSHLSQLETSERVSLIQDQWALVKSGRSEVEAFLDLLTGFSGENEYAVLDDLVARLALIRHRLVADEQIPAFERFVQKLLGAQLAQVGWESSAEESQDRKLHRAAVIRGLGVVGRSPEVLQGGKDRILKVLAGNKSALEANLHDSVLIALVRVGDAALFDRVLQAYQAETDPTFQRQYLQALAAFEAPELIAKAQGFVWSSTVRTQELPSYLNAVLANPVGASGFWTQLQTRWPELFKRLDNAPALVRYSVEAFGQLRERRQLEQLVDILRKHPLEEARVSSKQTVERLTQDVDLRERLMPRVSSWLSRSAS